MTTLKDCCSLLRRSSDKLILSNGTTKESSRTSIATILEQVDATIKMLERQIEIVEDKESIKTRNEAILELTILKRQLQNVKYI